MIRAIVAVDDKRGIARTSAQPSIPWDIPLDRQYFKDLTQSSVVLMGSETYKTLSGPLSNRQNVVVSRHLISVADGFKITTDLATYLENNTGDIWVIGGQELYETALQYCSELYITKVIGDFGCDKFFPDYSNFLLQSQSPMMEQHGYRFRFEVYKNR